MTTLRPLSRRQLLHRALLAGSAVMLAPLVGTDPPVASAQANRPIRVRVGELVQEGRADFAAGEADGVELPRAGGPSALTAGPEGGSFTSAILETDFPASHVGVHWRSDGARPGFELRTSRDGARWSRWYPLLIEAGKDETPRGETFGALVGARGARLLQYRVTFPAGQRSAELWRVSLTYLDAQPRGMPSARSTDSTEAGVGGFASLLAGPAEFRAQIVPREGWAADESIRYKEDGTEVWPRAYVPVKKVVVHHTATTNDYADGAAEVRAIYTYHAQTLGWGDIGYQLLIDNTGQVYEGRRGRDVDPEGQFARDIASWGVVAGHANPFNYGTSSISLIGNFQEAPLPAIMRGRLEEALTFECARYGVDPLEQSDYLLSNDNWRDQVPGMPGHRDCTPTECPGDHVYGLLPELRRTVVGRLGLGELPRPGPVTLDQGQNPWPGPLRFAWSGPPGARFSSFLEGWYRLPGQDEIVALNGYQPDTAMPAWSDWTTQTTASFEIPPEAHGHYTLHVRALAGRESLIWSRVSTLVEPQVPVDNSDMPLARAEGGWESTTSPRMYARRDFVYAPAGPGDRTFRWRLQAPRAGRYALQACWPGLEDFSSAAPFSIAVDGQQVAQVTVDQTTNGFSAWQALAELDLAAGATCEVTLTSTDDGKVAADAVRLLLVG